MIKMNAADSSLSTRSILALNWGDRWAVYHRLQALDIACQWEAHQPLLVEIPTPLAAIQVWNVVRQLTLPRNELVQWLETCWQI